MSDKISKEELDVILACAAFQMFHSSLENTQQLEDVCSELCHDSKTYTDMLSKAFYEGIKGTLPEKLEQVLSHVVRETFPSILKLSGSVQ